MWLKNYINEWKVWREIKKVYKDNQKDFEKVGLKSDYFGRLYKVINRDPSIPLGTPEDEILLQKEFKELNDFLISKNIIDLLALELIPQEESDDNTFENAYLIVFTPAYNLDKQYVSFKSTFWLFIGTCLTLTGLGYLINWLI